jgi:hypothetical protein
MTQVRFLCRRWFRNAFIAGIFAAFLAGCTNSDRIETTRGPGGRKTTTVGGADIPEEMRPVAMLGEQKFFDGRINAMVTVSQGLDGLARRGGWRTLGRTRADAPDLQDVFSRELYDQEKNDLGQTINKMVALQVMGSQLPPVLLRIQLNNTGAEPAEIGIELFKSYLGDFAVRPEKVSVPAGARSGPEGMSSRLGVTSNEIPVQLTLNLNGRSETHTVLVKNVVIEPAAPEKK